MERVLPAGAASIRKGWVLLVGDERGESSILGCVGRGEGLARPSTRCLQNSVEIYLKR